MPSEWEHVDKLASSLAEQFGAAPKAVIVLGSGLGQVAERLTDANLVTAAALPEWPASTVDGHRGGVLRGKLAGVDVVVQQGRVHLYEGYTAREVVRPLRAMVVWGARVVVLTNAAGAVDPNIRPGQLLAIEDQINLTGHSPLSGPDGAERGPRFPQLNDLYAPIQRARLLDISANLGIPLSSGIYAGLPGPAYETPAEVQMLASFGAQAVGMSTVLEAIAARHLGTQVIGLSCITNHAAGIGLSLPSHEEVQQMAASGAIDLGRLLAALFGEIAQELTHAPPA